MRLFLVLALVLAVGCTKQPAPLVPELPPPPPVAVSEPAPPGECSPEPQAGKNRIDLVVDGRAIGSLPARDCTVKAVAESNLILRIYPTTGIGMPVSTAVGEGLWEYPDEALMIPAFSVVWGNVTLLELDLTPVGMGKFTYTFVAKAATTYTLESGVGRSGPWTPIQGSLIPPEHGWLKFAYSGPMGRSEGPALGTREPHDLPVEWDGDQTAYLDLRGAPPVFRVYGGRDPGGFPARGPVRDWEYLYRGEKPRLSRVLPDGKVTTVAELQGVPERMRVWDGRLSYQFTGRGYFVDLVTGAHSEGPFMQGGHGYGETWIAAPGGGLLADLELPGGTDVRADRIDPADLVIKDVSHKEIVRVPDFLRAHRNIPSCTYTGGVPAMAWRPDGGAVAAISVPERGKLELVMYDLAARERRVLAAWAGGPGVMYDAITWSPGGRYLTVAWRLFDSQTGGFIADRVSPDVRWNPAGTHMLERQENPFRSWEEIAIIEAVTGKRIPLGYGDTLGWLENGEAVVVLWPLARHIPPPGKGCP